jgi:hypothetical protein
MKNIGRLWIAAVALIGGGVWTIFQYCHGETGFNFAWPMDGSKLTLNLTTYGPAVWASVLLIAAGLLMLAIALVFTIIFQFIPERRASYEDTSAKRILSLSE